MTFMLYVSVVALLAVLLALAFVRASPAQIAGSLRLVGPVGLGLLGLGALLIGRGGVAGMLWMIAVTWYMRARARRSMQRPAGGRSHVRTAALEMELDHDTGSLEGMVLAGSMEGRMLADLSLEDLLGLRGELMSDGESLQLLETYLDGRFAAWRDDAQANAGDGEGGAAASGPVTEEEAYEILGLEPGASAADVRKAHRRLMQRVHPDLGGSSFLAARINAAKDVLLSKHA
jgi:hypothetical protein